MTLLLGVVAKATIRRIS